MRFDFSPPLLCKASKQGFSSWCPGGGGGDPPWGRSRCAVYSWTFTVCFPCASTSSVFLDDFLVTGRGEQTPQLEFEQLPFCHPLFIMFSSGTTGAPKCMVHSAGVGLSAACLPSWGLYHLIAPTPRFQSAAAPSNAELCLLPLQPPLCQRHHGASASAGAPGASAVPMTSSLQIMIPQGFVKP